MSDVIPATHVDLLDSIALAHVATIGPSGEPQSSPVWFGWDGTFLRFAQVSGFQQKVRNLERDPRVALSIVDLANAYRYLEVRGRVERIEANPDWAFINAMAKKYLGQERYPFGKPGDEWLVVSPFASRMVISPAMWPLTNPRGVDRGSRHLGCAGRP